MNRPCVSIPLVKIILDYASVVQTRTPSFVSLLDHHLTTGFGWSLRYWALHERLGALGELNCWQRKLNGGQRDLNSGKRGQNGRQRRQNSWQRPERRYWRYWCIIWWVSRLPRCIRRQRHRCSGWPWCTRWLWCIGWQG